MPTDYYAIALSSRAQYALAVCVSITHEVEGEHMMDKALDLAISAGREAFIQNEDAECPIMLRDVPLLKTAFEWGVEAEEVCAELQAPVWRGEWQSSPCGRYEGRVCVFGTAMGKYRAEVELCWQGGEPSSVRLTEIVDDLISAQRVGNGYLQSEFWDENPI